EPGKSELSLGLVEWLNHRNVNRHMNAWMCVLGIISALAAIALAFAWDSGWIILFSAAMLSWSISASAIAADHRKSMPLPKPIRPLVRITVDRTTIAVILPTAGFTDD